MSRMPVLCVLFLSVVLAGVAVVVTPGTAIGVEECDSAFGDDLCGEDDSCQGTSSSCSSHRNVISQWSELKCIAGDEGFACAEYESERLICYSYRECYWNSYSGTCSSASTTKYKYGRVNALMSCSNCI
jgi:hypothetical protein